MKTKALTRTVSSIELLDARIAPASLTFSDVDGDLVHVTVSGSATTAQLDAAVHRVPSGAGFEITSVAFGGRSWKKGRRSRATNPVAFRDAGGCALTCNGHPATNG